MNSGGFQQPLRSFLDAPWPTSPLAFLDSGGDSSEAISQSQEKELSCDKIFNDSSPNDSNCGDKSLEGQNARHQRSNRPTRIRDVESKKIVTSLDNEVNADAETETETETDTAGVIEPLEHSLSEEAEEKPSLRNSSLRQARGSKRERRQRYMEIVKSVSRSPNQGTDTVTDHFIDIDGVTHKHDDESLVGGRSVTRDFTEACGKRKRSQRVVVSDDESDASEEKANDETEESEKILMLHMNEICSGGESSGYSMTPGT